MDVLCKIMEYITEHKEHIKAVIDMILIVRGIYAFLKKWVFVVFHEKWINNTYLRFS